MVKKLVKKMEVRRKITEHFTDYVHNWDHREYYLLGSYASSKSFNTAIKLILKSLYEKRKIMVVRKVFATLKESCYEDLIGAISFLKLDKIFTCTTSPLSIKCNKNGSRFIFRGMDKKEKIMSIKDISIIWIEENEITFDDYKELKSRLRVKGVKNHLITTSNPTNKQHWAYRHHFYDQELQELKLEEERFYKERLIIKDDVYYHHSTYKDNLENLNKDFVEELEKERDPLLKNIKVFGRFGTVGSKVFTNISKITQQQFEETQKKNLLYFDGLDFGYATSYNALVQTAVDTNNNDLYIYEQFYHNEPSYSKLYGKKLINPVLAEELKKYKIKGKITADGAEPKTIDALKLKGISIKGTGKKELIVEGIKKLKSFNNIFIVDICKDVWREFDSLEHPKDSKTGLYDEESYNIDPHSVDATRYALKNYRRTNLKGRNVRVPNFLK